MEFVPFGQDGIPPTAGKATKYRMLYNFIGICIQKGYRSLQPNKKFFGGPGQHGAGSPYLLKVALLRSEFYPRP
jgi:hypothetical protein